MIGIGAPPTPHHRKIPHMPSAHRRQPHTNRRSHSTNHRCPIINHQLQIINHRPQYIHHQHKITINHLLLSQHHRTTDIHTAGGVDSSDIAEKRAEIPPGYFVHTVEPKASEALTANATHNKPDRPLVIHQQRNKAITSRHHQPTNQTTSSHLYQPTHSDHHQHRRYPQIHRYHDQINNHRLHHR